VIDLLVSNPPYVAMRDRPSLAEELYYEPAEALFALDGAEGVPGFADVAQVIKGARPWMAPEGLLGVEMAEHQVELALALARDLGFEAVEAVIDLAGKPRGITALAP
jgi:methylase of polypeptide subunit release factors